MRKHKTNYVDNLDDILSVDRETKLQTRNLLAQRL